MAVSSGRKIFLDSEDARTMRVELEDMLDNPVYNTGIKLDDKNIYIEKHLNYISRFPYINSRQYVKNLKMKSRI